MNRTKVCHDEIPFHLFKKQNKTQQVQPVEDELTIESIVKVFNDKKNIKNDKKRHDLTKELFLEYLDELYNIDEDFL